MYVDIIMRGIGLTRRRYLIQMPWWIFDIQAYFIS